MQYLALIGQRAASQPGSESVEVIFVARVVGQRGIGQKVIIGVIARVDRSLFTTMALPVTLEDIEALVGVSICVVQGMPDAVKQRVLGTVDRLGQISAFAIGALRIELGGDQRLELIRSVSLQGGHLAVVDIDAIRHIHCQ